MSSIGNSLDASHSATYDPFDWTKMGKQEIEQSLKQPDRVKDLLSTANFEAANCIKHVANLGVTSDLSIERDALRKFIQEEWICDSDCFKDLLKIDPNVPRHCMHEGKSLFMQFLENGFLEKAALICPDMTDSFEGQLSSLCKGSDFDRAAFEHFSSAEKETYYRLANAFGRVATVAELNKLGFVSPSLSHMKFAIFGPSMDIVALSLRLQAIFTAMRDSGDFLTQSEYKSRYPVRKNDTRYSGRFTYEKNGFIEKHSLTRLFCALFFNTVCKNKGLTFPKANRFIAVVPDDKSTVEIKFFQDHRMMLPSSIDISVKAEYIDCPKTTYIPTDEEGLELLEALTATRYRDIWHHNIYVRPDGAYFIDNEDRNLVGFTALEMKNLKARIPLSEKTKAEIDRRIDEYNQSTTPCTKELRAKIRASNEKAKALQRVVGFDLEERFPLDFPVADILKRPLPPV